MKHVAISLGTLSPLAIRADHAPGGLATAPYIPGSTFLGSLAAAHRKLYGDQAREFEQLFLRGQVLYPNLYPAAFKDQGIEEAKKLPVYPIPMTAQSCKRHSGFFPTKPEDDDDEHHGVRDTLFDWAAYKIIEQNSTSVNAMQVFKAIKDCQECLKKNSDRHTAMDHFEGFYRREEADPARLHSAAIDSRKRLRTHTGINRERGSVEESILYNRQVFEEDMLFWGEVRLSDDEGLFKTLDDFIREIGSKGWVRIGTGRSRGMGKVAISANEVEQEEEPLKAFTGRLREFNQQLKEYVRKKASELQPGEPELAPFYIALTLHSPAILCDDRLRYYGTIDEKTLAKQAKLTALPFKCLYQAASTRRIMGWNELWGMPRGHEFAIDTGSVFLYVCESEPDTDTLLALYNLEEEGIGRRRAEGFGRVRFSDPFHLEVNLR